MFWTCLSTVVDHESILKVDSGITDWREDLQHLHNQLLTEQPGTCSQQDMSQRKTDNRKLLAKLRADAKNVTGAGMDEIEADDEEEEDITEERNKKTEADDVTDDDDDDLDFVVKEREMKRQKLDVMGPVSSTADRLGLSVRQRTMISAAVANSLGVDIDTTNINTSSAWKRSKQERLTMSSKIKEEFPVPPKLVGHWDGKIFKIKGNLVSNRVCVYITGVTSDKLRKLLGVPETRNGTGAAEAKSCQDSLS